MKRLLLATPLLLLLGCSVSVELRLNRVPKEFNECLSVCKTCQGMGQVEDIVIRSAPPEPGEEVSRTITCPECRGKGKK